VIEGVGLKRLKVYCDDRGYFAETLREDDPFFNGFAQSSVTLSYPGVIKAFHWHKKQDDYWYVVKGSAQVVLHDLREGSPTKGQTDVYYLGDENRSLLFIPRGVAHGYRVLGPEPVVLVYYVTAAYNPQDPDEQRIAWDDPAIGFNWQTQNK
jgi:dTDP-4-dehydrorhamnose 3,5-epimerase